jgi:gamma-glutamyltranspeptidase/glutathione hydrolase
MRGAIAAGHPVTAQVGADVLASGGNAVDACVAASLASWVCESPLTGPGGGGFMLVHRARDRTTRVLDFFVAVPSGAAAGMTSVDVDFSGGSTQVFRIGPASVAVPGAAVGLREAHRMFGSLPWRDLFPPAIRLAREGVELTPGQAYLHAILDVILRSTEEGRRLYGREMPLGAGERLVLADLAPTLELLAEEGAEPLYRGELARRIVACTEGRITEEDLGSYRVIRRRPVEAAFRGYVFRANPPPSTGGLLIGYGLRLLDGAELGAPGSAEAIARVVEVMREQRRARDERFARDLYRGGLARRLLGEGVGGTTHISVVDSTGNAASLSISTGAGSGVIASGTGIHLNNMVGEYDLVETGVELRPGKRMTSMMAPSIALEDGRPRFVVGSAGSLRLRGAILQVLVNALGHGMEAESAIRAPRVHLDAEVVHCEGGHDAAELDRLEAMGYALTRWRRRNLYFGGTSAVELLGDGTLRAAGDPRRGGHGIVVD